MVTWAKCVTGPNDVRPTRDDPRRPKAEKLRVNRSGHPSHDEALLKRPVSLHLVQGFICVLISSCVFSVFFGAYS